MKSNILLWILALLPLMVTLLLLPYVPDRIPAHYGFSGEVNRWGSKYETLLLPAITIVLAAVLQIAQFAGRKQLEKRNNQKAIMAIGFSLMAVFNVLTYVFLYTAVAEITNISGSGFNVPRIVAVIIGVLFVFIGLILPETKQNALIGIRIKWTLENKTVWERTHRFGGRVFIICGVAIALVNLFWLNDMASLVSILAGVVAAMLIVSVYARGAYREVTGK